jgi:hypothetical protein
MQLTIVTPSVSHLKIATETEISQRQVQDTPEYQHADDATQVLTHNWK